MTAASVTAPRAARVHKHGDPRTFDFQDGSVIRLCPQCEAFDSERKRILRTNTWTLPIAPRVDPNEIDSNVSVRASTRLTQCPDSLCRSAVSFP